MRHTIIAWLLSVWVASGASYYINFQDGSDSNSGAITSPWKRCPGDANATGNAAAATLSAGDRVYFTNTVTYTGEIELAWSGSSGNPIIYDGSSWGVGTRATIDGGNVAKARGFNDESSARSHLYFTGFIVQNLGGYAEDDAIWSTTTAVSSSPNGVGFDLKGGGTGVTVTNCLVQEIGQWQNVIPMSGINSVSGTGVSLENNKDLLVVDCEFTRMKTGVSIKTQGTGTGMISNVVVRGTEFHDYMNWLIDMGPRSANTVLANITIDGCSFYDYKQFDEPNWTGYGEKPHQDGIFMRTTGLVSTWTNIVIKNSRWWSDDVSNGGTASIYLSEGASADIYNCTFRDDHHANAAINMGFAKPVGMYQQIRVWNCTFIGGVKAFRGGNGTANPDVVEFLNNIAYRQVSASSSIVMDLGPTSFGTFVCDYNLYLKDTASPSTANMFYDGGYKTFAAWKASYGVDANSSVVATNDLDLTYLLGDPSTWDLQPLATSPALGAGTNLSAYFTTDINGQARGSMWSIGAFQDTNSFSLSPEILTATLDSTGTNLALTGNQALFEGSGGTAGFTLSMNAGAATLVYRGGSGTSTLNYSTERTIYDGETGSLSYTQGGNGIEGSDGTDLATFSGLTVANNSSQQQPAPSGASGRAIRLKGIKARP